MQCGLHAGARFSKPSGTQDGTACQAGWQADPIEKVGLLSELSLRPVDDLVSAGLQQAGLVHCGLHAGARISKTLWITEWNGLSGRMAGRSHRERWSALRAEPMASR